jgi:hypothetical protein
MKALLAREEAEHSHLFANILHAIKPIMVEGEGFARQSNPD